MSTFFVKKEDAINPKWHVVDAKGEVLGRLASRISQILMGKHRPEYTPHTLSGDGVVVINASGIRVTGKKAESKVYKFYSGYPSGLREVNFENMMKKDPSYALKHAVKGMLPKSRLGRRMITRLLVYANAEHPHGAQLAAGKGTAKKKSTASKAKKA